MFEEWKTAVAFGCVTAVFNLFVSAYSLNVKRRAKLYSLYMLFTAYRIYKLYNKKRSLSVSKTGGMRSGAA